MSDWLSPETRRWARLKILDMQADVAAIRLLLALQRVEVKYDPNQPRVPRGNPDGGQWTRVGGGSGGGRAPSLAERAQRALSQTFWGGAHESAEALRQARTRVDEWLKENFNGGGIEAFSRANSDFQRGLILQFGGEEALRALDESMAPINTGSEEVGAMVRARIDAAVARGDITRERADDATVLVTTAAGAGTPGIRRKPGGGGKKPPSGSAPKIELQKPPQNAAPGARAYKVGVNDIVLSPAGKKNFHVSFEIRTDYGAVRRPSGVRNAQDTARARGKLSDVGFHTMAHRFFPGLEETVVPGDAVLNASGWRKMENRIAATMKKGGRASGSISLSPVNARRPRSFSVDIQLFDEFGNDAGAIRRKFENEKE